MRRIFQRCHSRPIGNNFRLRNDPEPKSAKSDRESGSFSAEFARTKFGSPWFHPTRSIRSLLRNSRSPTRANSSAAPGLTALLTKSALSMLSGFTDRASFVVSPANSFTAGFTFGLSGGRAVYEMILKSDIGNVTGPHHVRFTERIQRISSQKGRQRPPPRKSIAGPIPKRSPKDP